MRNAEWQEKLQEMLDELQHLPDDLVVAHYTGLGLMETSNVFFELLNAEGGTASATDKIDCIVVAIN